MQYKSYITLLGLASFTLASSCFFFENSFLLRYAWVPFLIHYLLILGSLRVFNNRVKFIFSPTFLAISYIYINYIIGSYSLANGLINDIYLVKFDHYYDIQGMNNIISYNVICIYIIFLSYNYNYDNKINEQLLARVSNKLPFRNLIFGIICLVPFTIFEFHLDIIGGSGDFSVIPRTIAILYIIFNVSKGDSKIRYLIYVSLFIYMMLINYDSKREVFYLLLPFLFFEFIRKGRVINFNFKKICLYVILLIVGCYSLLAMTIMRGFGNYVYKNTFEAFLLVPKLTKDYDILSLILKVSEAPTTTYHSFKAINYVILEPSNTTYGATYLKALYIPFPRSIFPEKPESMTTIFTRIENFAFDSIGGSYPINFISESYWNFNYIGMIVVFMTVFFLNKLYHKMHFKIVLNRNINVSIVFMIFVWTYMLGFYRGYGIDLYSVLIFVGLLFSSIIVGLDKLLSIK